MKYETVVNLRKAGFPQKQTGSVFYQPTLEELIDEIGDEFEDLDHVKKGDGREWEASANYFCCEEHGYGRKYAYGSTPKETLAALYIALHQ